MNNEQQKDNELWKIAKARVAFRWSFTIYFLMNGFLIGVWFFTTGLDSYFWPVWPMMGWGIGIAFQYFHAYHGNRLASTQEEFEKLKRKEQQ
jgi:hypothetical protein